MDHVTISILIGNSDNKLSQADWADYISNVNVLLQGEGKIHFVGYTGPTSERQSACWVLEGSFIVGPQNNLALDRLRLGLSVLAAKYHQDSIAFVVGTTHFITPDSPQS